LRAVHCFSTMTYLIRLSALLSALLLLTSPAAGHQPKSISFTEAEAGLTGTGGGSTATDQTRNGHDGMVNGAAWVNNQDANPPEASAYSEDFSDDPEYEVFYENTDGETEVYWDNSSKDFYAKVRD
jgi:hypothetical protein